MEGAEPGDTLAIHLISVEPARDWAVSTMVPLFGSLTGTRYTATPPRPAAGADMDVFSRPRRRRSRLSSP